MILWQTFASTGGRSLAESIVAGIFRSAGGVLIFLRLPAMHRNPPGTHQDEVRDFRVLEPVPFFTGEAMRVRYPSFCHFIIG